MVAKERICGRKPEKKKNKEKWKIEKNKSTANRSVEGENRIRGNEFENFRIDEGEKTVRGGQGGQGRGGTKCHQTEHT